MSFLVMIGLAAIFIILFISSLVRGGVWRCWFSLAGLAGLGYLAFGAPAGTLVLTGAPGSEQTGATVLWAIFAVGTFWFYALVVGMTVLIFWATAYEQGTLIAISILTALGLLQFFGGLNIIGYFKEHWLLGPLYVAGYFAAGLAVSLPLWWLYVKERSDQYEELHAEFKLNQHVAGENIPPGLMQEWKNTLRHYGFGNNVVPLVRNHKALIGRYVAYWPWYGAWSLIDDVVKRIWTEIWRLMQHVYQAIAHSAFRGAKDIPE